MGDTLKVLLGDTARGVTLAFVSKLKQWSKRCFDGENSRTCGLMASTFVRIQSHPLVEARFDSGGIVTVELELDGCQWHYAACGQTGSGAPL